MSTRSCIARPRKNGLKRTAWEGVYHHSDGYPSGVGRTVWNLLKNRYHGDVDKFYSEIIDQNLDGWSNLHCFHPEWGSESALMQWDGKRKITVEDRMTSHPDAAQYPVSYQFDPKRATHEKECSINDDDPDPLSIKWVYIVKPIYLRILKSVPCKSAKTLGSTDYGHCAFKHVLVEEFSWYEKEPNWKLLEIEYADA